MFHCSYIGRNRPLLLITSCSRERLRGQGIGRAVRLRTDTFLQVQTTASSEPRARRKIPEPRFALDLSRARSSPWRVSCEAEQYPRSIACPTSAMLRCWNGRKRRSWDLIESSVPAVRHSGFPCRGNVSPKYIYCPTQTPVFFHCRRLTACLNTLSIGLSSEHKLAGSPFPRRSPFFVPSRHGRLVLRTMIPETAL